MSKLVSMKDTCIRLLTPNDTLDVTIFDTHGDMYPEVRQELLNIANDVINKSIGFIPGLKVKDICLNGSCASYFYHDKSDIDIKIDIVNENCSFLTTDAEPLIRFMGYMKSTSFPNHKFSFNGRFVDIKFTSKQQEIMGLYSILNNQWVIVPDKNITQNLNVDDLMEEYTKRFYQIKEHLRNIIDSGEILTVKGLHDLEKYYINMYSQSYSSVREFIIFKMLKYRSLIKEIQNTFNDYTKRALNIE